MRAGMREIGPLTRPCRAVLGTMAPITEKVAGNSLRVAVPSDGLRHFEARVCSTRSVRHQIRPKCRSACSMASRFSGGQGATRRPRPARFAARRVDTPRRVLTCAIQLVFGTLNKFLYLAVGRH